MSLQVWLPLNGNLNNQGLSNVTVTNNGVTIDNSGKIGKCYSFNGSSYIDTGYVENFDVGNFTISAWIYFVQTAGKTWQCIVGNKSTAGKSVGCAIYWNQNQKKFLWSTADGTTAKEIWSVDTFDSILYDSWHHIVMVRDNNDPKKGYFYFDGVRKEIASVPTILNVSSATTMKIGSCTPSSSNYFYTGKINDVRIYDYALSKKEVHEIYKTLVLHYKLDDIVNENLISSIKSYNPSTYNAYQYNLSENLIAGETYTFQLWDVTVSHSAKTEAQLGISIYWGGGSVSLKTMNGTSWFTNGHSDYIKFTITIASSQASGTGATNSWLNIYNSVGYVAGTLNMHIGCIKVEKGNIGTSFVNYGLPKPTIIYDTSGYCNHGTITGNLNVSNNTPRYNCSTYFNGSSYIKTLPGELTWTNFETLTISAWMKPTTTPSNYTGSIGIGNDASNANKYICINNYGGRFTVSIANGAYTNINSGYTCPLNEWHHYAATLNGTELKMYVDGILKNTQTITWNSATLHANPQFQVGVDLPGTDEIYTGYYSDVRIYATALSADDIKELYTTAAFFDKSGNLHCYKIEEKESHNILKTGIVETSNWIEPNDKLKLLDDGSVWLQILHHNNPANNLFRASNCWFYNNSDLFSILYILKDTPIASLSEFEFLACEKLTNSSTEVQYRWKQTSNPALSSTLTGYELISGNPGRPIGLMNKNTYGCFHNGSTWWCCCGSYTDYNGGIPGFGGKVTSGYLDLYIKIPFDILNTEISGRTKFFKKSIVSNQMLEI